MTVPAPLALTDWHAALQRHADEQGIGWAIASVADEYREAFASGIAPDDYLADIQPLTEWRGCGCGGG